MKLAALLLGFALAFQGDIPVRKLPPEARQTLELIERNGPFPYPRDGVVFNNREKLLPQRERGYYREYTVRTPGARDPARSGVYRIMKPDAIFEVIPSAARIDLKGGDALRAIARALEFPDWFGGNWDALEDCLGDLSWRPAGDPVLVFENWQELPDLGVLLDVLRSSAEYWSGRGRPFFAVLVDPGGKLALPALHRE